MRALIGLSAVVVSVLAFASCSEDKPAPLGVAPTDAGTTPPSLETPSSACADVESAVYGDPGALSADASARGTILKCSKQADVTKEAMQAKLTELGFAGRPLTSSARVYKISYQTERGDAAGTAGYSSAIVYIPEMPRAVKLPIVVGARGSRGQAASCAVSKFDPALTGINDDAYRMIYPLVGSGYAIIVPDLAGYANFGAAKNPASAYAQAADVGRGTLDGSRALKKLFPALDDKVVLVGHSQGGHSALSALALADTYGAAGPIVGAALFAPLWVSQRSWGAVLNRLAGGDFPLATVPAIGNVSVWYHYTQAELLDGPGEGIKLFRADRRPLIESFVKSECWDSRVLSTPTAEVPTPAVYVDELFDVEFVRAVSQAATTGAACTSDVCEKWINRYTLDRPRLTGTAATTPILLAYGLKDTTIAPGRMKCALDRLVEDAVNLTTCVEPEANHGTIVSTRGEYVGDWIASVALGAAAPAACATTAAAVTETCTTPPPND